MSASREQLLCSYETLLTHGRCQARGIDDRTDPGPLTAEQEEWLTALRAEAAKDTVSITSDIEQRFGEFFWVRAVARAPSGTEWTGSIHPESAQWRQRFEKDYAKVLPAARARVAADLAALPRRARLTQSRDIQARIKAGESWHGPTRETAIEVTTSTITDKPGLQQIVEVARYADGSTQTRAFYADGAVKSESWRDANGELDRLDGPALQEWHPNGILSDEEWLVGGVYDRANGPALRRWANDGRLREERWMLDGSSHRIGGPAYRSFNEKGELVLERWDRDGHFHRTDGPARAWWGDGVVLHCEEVWYLEGRLHRDGGPAKRAWNWQGIDYYEAWYQHGRKHREDGPAWQAWCGADEGVEHHESWHQRDKQIRSTTTLLPAGTELEAMPARRPMESQL